MFPRVHWYRKFLQLFFKLQVKFKQKLYEPSVHGEECKEHLLVMDLLGNSLQKELSKAVKCPKTGKDVRKGKLDFDETANVAVQILKQIKVLHKNNLLHRRGVFESPGLQPVVW